MSEILTTEQAAGMLQFSVPYTRTLALRGEIPGIKWGDDWRFIKQQLIDHLIQAATREQQSRKFEHTQRATQQVATGLPPVKKKAGRPRRELIALP